jgi:L-erythro-3,5-diaminohexanoate dehydrogenase
MSRIDGVETSPLGSSRSFMKTTVALEEIRQRLGEDRVVDPPGALPQPAARLDPAGPVRPYEFEVAVERILVDSTSFRQIGERCGSDADRMAERITEIVAARGKLHNPDTDSGGVLCGAVTEVGERYDSPPVSGDRIVTLASLTLTPLRLEAVNGLDPGSPQVEVAGTAYVSDRAAWAPLPGDLPLETALEVYDVCAAASATRALATLSGTVCVMGAGHAGRLVLAAARDVAPEATLVAVDVDAASIERLTGLGLCDVGVTADLRDPLASLEAVRAAGSPPADLTVVVVNAPGCEPTAVLLTAEEGSVLFFSMATSFSAAALAADGIGSGARLLLGSGYSPDRGAYALDLVRGSPALRRALDLEWESP